MSNKERSYRNRVTRGDVVTFVAPHNNLVHTVGQTFNQDVADNVRLAKGQQYVGTVVNESNGGFRGIEMTVDLGDGTTVTGISTGCIIA